MCALLDVFLIAVSVPKGQGGLKPEFIHEVPMQVCEGPLNAMASWTALAVALNLINHHRLDFCCCISHWLEMPLVDKGHVSWY